jgi:hypothetical protein
MIVIKLIGKFDEDVVCFFSRFTFLQFRSLLGDKLYEIKGKAKKESLKSTTIPSDEPKKEKIPESEIPFLSSYISFPKYVSQGLCFSLR